MILLLCIILEIILEKITNKNKQIVMRILDAGVVLDWRAKEVS